MSPLPRRTALAVAVLAAVACGGSDEPSGPATSNGSPVAAQLSQLSARLGTSSPAAAYIGMASTGLALGVQPSPVVLTVNAARRAPASGLSLAVAGTAAGAGIAEKFSAVGFRLIGRNVPGLAGDLEIDGGVMWDDTMREVVVVMGSGTVLSFGDVTSSDDFAVGVIHRVSPEASWLATAGTMQVSAPTTSGACPGAPTPGFTCALGSFGLAYDIGGSAAVPYAGNGATGSRSASLAAATVNGFVMTMDYARLGASGRRALLDAAAAQPR